MHKTGSTPHASSDPYPSFSKMTQQQQKHEPTVIYVPKTQRQPFLLSTPLIIKTQIAVNKDRFIASPSQFDSLSFYGRLPLQRSNFKTVTRYLDNVHQLLQVYRLKEGAWRRQELYTFHRGLNFPNWSGIISHYRRINPSFLAQDALKAFHGGQIRIEQFCTSTFCWELLRQEKEPIYVQPFFTSEGRVVRQAELAIQQGFYAEENFFEAKEVPSLLERFFDLMRQTPVSEQCFFYVECNPPSPSAPQCVETIGKALTYMLGFKIFDVFQIKKRFFRMIPSFSMLQAIVDAYGAENRIALCPTLKMSTSMDFLINLKNRGREICIPFLGIPSPLLADEFDVEDFFAFLRHDLYHALLMSQIPEPIRQETASLAETILALKEQCAEVSDPFTIPFLEILFERMVDMEFVEFHQRNKKECGLMGQSNAALFLIALHTQIHQVTYQRLTARLIGLFETEKENKNALSSQDLGKWRELYTTDQEALMRRFQQFCAKSPVFKELARVLYHRGFLERFSLSYKELEEIEITCQRFMPVFSRNSFLTHHLAAFSMKTHDQDI